MEYNYNFSFIEIHMMLARILLRCSQNATFY